MAKKTDILGLHRIKNTNVKRNVFDLTSQRFVTQSVGEILPVFCEEVMPNDRLSINSHCFSRTAPLSSTAFASFSHEVKFFFVPYSLMWRFFRPQITNTSMFNLNGDNDSYIAGSLTSGIGGSTNLPYFQRVTLRNAIVKAATNGGRIGRMYQRSVGMAKLAESLGYGSFPSVLDPSKWSVSTNDIATWNGSDGDDVNPDYLSNANIALNPFRYLAYHKACYDYYRIKQWQQNRANMYNLDYIMPNGTSSLDSSMQQFVNDGLNSPCFFDINQCTLPLSIFNGALPKPQFGSTASAKVTGDISIANPTFYASGKTGSAVTASASANTNNLLIGGNKVTKIDGDVPYDGLNVSINDLRNAFALQRYREIVGSNDTDYISQIEAHFGFRPKVESTKSTFIGGFSDDINVSTVVNNNLADNNSTVLGGLMQGGSTGSVDFVAPDYGIVIGLSTYVPQFSYPSLQIDRRNTFTDVTDYPVPELDSIGMQELRTFELDASPSFLDNVGVSSSVGYVPRYFEWKIGRNNHMGYFNFALNNQVLGFSSAKMLAYDRELSSSYEYVSSWLMCYPEYCDNVFTNNRHQLLSDDCFYSAYNFNVSAVRSLSVYGLPDCN